MIFFILYIKIGLIFTLLFTIIMIISGQDITLEDLIGTTLLYPLIIYYLITKNF
jgi:hypothetical protein